MRYLLLAALLLLGCVSPPQVDSFDDCVKAGYPVLDSFPRECKTPDGRTFVSVEDQILSKIDSFEECEAAGYPVMESYPRQCRTPDGRNFVEKIPQGLDEQGERCCDECVRAFIRSPAGAGPDGVKCGYFTSADPPSDDCLAYFTANPSTPSQCGYAAPPPPPVPETPIFTPGACNALEQNGPMDDKLNIIFIPSHHYTDMADFAQDLPAFRDALFAFPFYNESRNKINLFFLASANASDGCYLAGNTTPACDIPSMRSIAAACNYTSGDQIVALFDNRAVPTPYARGEGPDDILFIGSGSSSVFVHEFSHSFGDLGDTYDGSWNNTVDPSYPNCASATPGFTCADKWGDLIGTGSGDQLVGCYQNCHAENWYRPTMGGDIMRNLGYSFYDPVSLRHMQSKMADYT